MPNDTNNITLDNLRHATLVLECNDKFVLMPKGIDIPWDTQTDFANSKELEDFLSQFQRSELNA